MDKIMREKTIGVAFTLLALFSVALGGFMVQSSLADAPVSEHGARFQEFPDYARALWRGGTGIATESLETRLYSDVILHEGRIQLPFGPVPVALFMPLAWLPFDIFPTLSVTFLLLAAAGLLVYRIAGSRGLADRDALWVAAAYSLGSAVAPLVIPVPNSWSVILIANVFLLLALDSHLSERPSWVTGTFLALATMTRPVSAIGVLAYVLLTSEWGKTQEDGARRRKTVSAMAGLFASLIIAVAVIGAYNHLRFGDFTETGYGIQWQADPVLQERMVHGSMNLRYVPRNLRYFLIEPPNVIDRFPFVLPDRMGMGIVFGSPFMLYILFACGRWRKMLKPLAAAAVGLVPALTFYASGFTQIGYRYAVDVYPLLFLALIAAFGDRIPRPAKFLIALSVVAHVVWMVALLT